MTLAVKSPESPSFEFGQSNTRDPNGAGAILQHWPDVISLLRATHPAIHADDLLPQPVKATIERRYPQDSFTIFEHLEDVGTSNSGQRLEPAILPQPDRAV